MQKGLWAMLVDVAFLLGCAGTKNTQEYLKRLTSLSLLTLLVTLLAHPSAVPTRSPRTLRAIGMLPGPGFIAALALRLTPSPATLS